MKDIFDMVIDVRGLLNVPDLRTKIDGLYATLRPDGSRKADVVVNGLHISQTQDQIGAGNINIYVPEKVDIYGNLSTDLTRMSELGKIVASLIKSVYKPSFRVFLDGQPEPIRDTDGSYLVNVRYKYYSIQNEQVEV